MEQLIIIGVVLVIFSLVNQSKKKNPQKGQGAASHKASSHKPPTTAWPNSKTKTNATDIFKSLMDTKNIGSGGLWSTLAEILEDEARESEHHQTMSETVEEISNTSAEGISSEVVNDRSFEGEYYSGEGESLTYDGHVGGSLSPGSDHGHFEGQTVSAVMLAEREAERQAAQKQSEENIFQFPQKTESVDQSSRRSAFSFTTHPLKNAVIMSEVLDKPVALRRRR